MDIQIKLDELQNKLVQAERHAQTLKTSKYGATEYPMAKIMVESIKRQIQTLENDIKNDSK
jgi:hypothetical protein